MQVAATPLSEPISRAGFPNAAASGSGASSMSWWSPAPRSARCSALLFPTVAVEFKLLGDAFISLIKMTIAPLIFLVVVTGIAQVGDMKAVGRIGLKAFVYFEVVTTAVPAVQLRRGALGPARRAAWRMPPHNRPRPSPAIRKPMSARCRPTSST